MEPPKTTQNHPNSHKTSQNHNKPQYARGQHCHIISVMQYQALQRHNITQHRNQNVFQVALNRIGILWEVLGRFGRFCWWFWVVLAGLAGFGWFHVLVTTSKYPLFTKSKWLCSLVPENPWGAIKDDNSYTFQLQSKENGVLSKVPNHKRPTIQIIEQ